MKTEVRAKSWASTVVGKRELFLDAVSVTVFPKGCYGASLAGWLETPVDASDRHPRYSHVTYVLALPTDLKALIRGVLKDGHPIEPLIDWVIEFGPPNLAAALEAMCKSQKRT